MLTQTSPKDDKKNRKTSVVEEIEKSVYVEINPIDRAKHTEPPSQHHEKHDTQENLEPDASGYENAYFGMVN